jgi:hypothetical protein
MARRLGLHFCYECDHAQADKRVDNLNKIMMLAIGEPVTFGTFMAGPQPKSHCWQSRYLSDGSAFVEVH